MIDNLLDYVAHIAGFAGKHVRRGRVNRIYGVDPAGPLFDVNNPSTRLDYRDADYVESIHTDNYLGIGATISHVDIFPNNGKAQPGCGNPMCNHSRAVHFFVEAINSSRFISRRCEGLNGIRQGLQCTGDLLVMGEPSNAINRRRGIYQVFTYSQSPFGMG